MKRPTKSKTIWFALALDVLGVIQLGLPETRELLGPWYGVTLIVVGIAIKILRFVTTQPIGWHHD